MAVVGGLGAVLALGLLALAFFMARYREEGAPGTNTLVFPAAFLMALSFRDLSGESVIALAVLSLAAYLLTFLSGRWQSPGVRVTSYFLQAMVMGAAFILLLLDPGGGMPLATAAAMTAVSAFAFMHYMQLREFDPPEPSIYFGRIDKQDRARVLPFIASLAAAFFMLRAISFMLLSGDMFKASESVIINLGAALLFIASLKIKDEQVRNVAKLVTAVGASKVFMLDLLKIKGLPILLSVFSFGIAAALGSVILTKWNRNESEV
jgi:hypothetical protein